MLADLSELQKSLILISRFDEILSAMPGKSQGVSPDEVFEALGNPGRSTLVRTLMSGERFVCDLVHAVGLGWSTTSRHLDILRDAGAVSSDKRGQKIFYRLELNCVPHFIECLDRARPMP